MVLRNKCEVFLEEKKDQVLNEFEADQYYIELSPKLSTIPKEINFVSTLLQVPCLGLFFWNIPCARQRFFGSHSDSYFHPISALWL